MNELGTQQQEQGLVYQHRDKRIIQSSIADSTLKRFSSLHHRAINLLPRISANKHKGPNNEHL